MNHGSALRSKLLAELELLPYLKALGGNGARFLYRDNLNMEVNYRRRIWTGATFLSFVGRRNKEAHRYNVHLPAVSPPSMKVPIYCKSEFQKYLLILVSFKTN